MRDALLLPLSHHTPEQYDHCWWLPMVGGRSVPVCARCTGVYPVALVLLTLQLLGRFSLAATDSWLVVVLPLPAVVEFLGEQFGFWRGSNLVRIGTGLPLGVALSRLFVRYFAHPADPVFWGIVAVYGGLCGLSALFVLFRQLPRK
jgi:uncharacterized membrane protein